MGTALGRYRGGHRGSLGSPSLVGCERACNLLGTIRRKSERHGPGDVVDVYGPKVPGICALQDVASELQRLSENFVEANFAKLTYHKLRRCRSELHTSRGRKRKVRIFESSRRFDTPLRMALNNPPVPLPIPSKDVPEPFKAALNVFVAEERALDGPEDLTGKATAQIGLYAHRGQDSRTSGNRPPP